MPEANRNREANTTLPRLSVVIPACNQEQFIPDAIASVLEQGFSDIEIIVVDDGSSDRTAQVAQRLSPIVKVLSQENAGPAAARNVGLRAARGPIIAFLDADDVWPKAKLARQLQPLESDPTIEICLGRTRLFCAPSQLEGAGPPSASGFSVQLGSSVFRRDVFKQVGHFNEALRFSEDHDWFFRAREAGCRLVLIDCVTLYHRKHADSMTEKRRQTGDGYGLPGVLRDSLRRRRQNSSGAQVTLPPLTSYPLWP